MILRLLIVLIGSALFWWGGYSWKPARRFIMPVVLTVYSLLLTSSYIPLGMLSSIGIFCLGYGIESPLRHIFGNGWGRGIWGLLAAICLSLPLLLTHHLLWWLFVSYLALNFVLENALKNVNQKIGDFIIGAGFASIIIVLR